MQRIVLESTVTQLDPAPLAADATWTPDRWLDRYAGEELIRRARVEVKADQTGTLYLEESENADGSGATILDTVPVTANVTTEITWSNLTKQFYRPRFVNGGTAQTTRMYLFVESAGRELVDVEISRRGSDLIKTHDEVTAVAYEETASPVQSAIGYNRLAVGVKANPSGQWNSYVRWFADPAGTIPLCDWAIHQSYGETGYGGGGCPVQGPYFQVIIMSAVYDRVVSSWTTLFV